MRQERPHGRLGAGRSARSPEPTSAAKDAVLRASGMFTWGELASLRRVLMRLWCRCFGPGRSLGLVLGGGRPGGRFAVAGRGGAERLPGSVGSEGEAGDCADRGERRRGEEHVVEPAGGAGAGGVGHRGAGGGRDRGGDPGAGAGGHRGVRDSTTGALIVAEAMHESAPADVPHLTAAIADELNAIFSATPTVTVLSQAAPRFTFGP
jgi:hypothetical protein